MHHPTYKAQRAGAAAHVNNSVPTSVVISGPPAGLIPPTKGNAPKPGSQGGVWNQEISEQSNCAVQQPDEQDSRQFASLAAQANRAGIALHRLADGYLLCRWAYSRELPDLRAVAMLLRQMGVCQ